MPGRKSRILTLTRLLRVGVACTVWACATTGYAQSQTQVGAGTPSAAQDEVQFDEAFLRSPVDIRAFNQGTVMPEGEHRIDVAVNGAWKGRYRVGFRAAPSGGGAQPCFDAALLDGLGLAHESFAPSARAALLQGPVCEPLGDIVPGAQARFDSSQLQLDVSVPQSLLSRQARGYVDPALWDDGITAATLQYDYLAYHAHQSAPGAAGGDTSHYLGLRAGLNVGKWRLRYRSTLNAGAGRATSYQGISAYAERGITSWRSRVMVGDAVTDGQVFNSMGFRGVQLASEDRMYPDSQRGYAPVIRGIANSNARVSVRQQGSVIYETAVPPGPFVIDDLYPSGAGGDLQVTVTEADGSMNTFSVAYAAMPELLRPGVTRYSVTAGQYRNSVVPDTPALFMGTLRHGFSNRLTAYAGGLGAQGYQAVAGGLAVNTAWGAVSSDITYARTGLDKGVRHTGSSVRVGYAKVLPVTQTHVTVATYRYASAGFYDANDAFMLRHAASGDTPWGAATAANRRNRLQLSLAQNLPGNWGTLSANASRQDYWRGGGADTEFQVQYNNHVGRLSYGISAGRSRLLETGQWNDQLLLTLSVPLGSSVKAPSLGTTVARDRHARSAQAALSGVAGDDHQLGYNVYTSTTQGGPGPRASTAGASGSWFAPSANLGASVSAGKAYRQYSASLSGGMVAYGGGLVLGPALGETAALVEVPGAQGARVAHFRGLRLDGRGRAIVPYLSPYRQNLVEIDPKGLSTDVAIQQTGRHLAPTAGAVALLQFDTEEGHSVLMTFTDAAAQALPFGATVFDGQGHPLGYVAQTGQALLRLPAQTGDLQVKWGAGAADACQASYDLSRSGARQAAGFRVLDVSCLPNQGGVHVAS